MRDTSTWRTDQTRRLAFLLDGEEYFPAFTEAVRRAARTVYIAGWDIDSRVALLDRGGDDPLTLGELLKDAAENNPDLEIFVLPWDYSILFAGEREQLPLVNVSWRFHERVHYNADDLHPFGASHHQKFVVVDDAIAFVGGMDLAAKRWDTRSHEREEPRRVGPDRKPYGPYHDLQALVDADAATTLGAYFRYRWRSATGQQLEPPDIEHDSHDPWPRSVPPWVEDVPVHFSRTQPDYAQFDEARETARSLEEIIERAEQSLYIENQYLSSELVVSAIAERLRAPDGPEVVLVLPKISSNWLARKSMDLLRSAMMRRLMSADAHSRLRIVYPAIEMKQTEVEDVYVHAKVVIADDRLCFVGSANLANRSMGLDTELNLTLEADTAPPERQQEARDVIAGLRNRLLGELSGEREERVEELFAETGSLIETVERLGAGGHCFKPVPLLVDDDEVLERLARRSKLLDPEKPVAIDRLLNVFLMEGPPRGELVESYSWSIVVRAVAFALIIVAGVIAWRYTPLAEWLSLDLLVGWGGMLEGQWWTPLAILGAFFLSGFLFLPITLLIVVAALIFDPLHGILYGLGGALVSSLSSYGLGHVVGKEMVRKVAGDRLNSLSKQLARRGTLAMAVIRNLPIAPYHVVNMIAGASHIRLRDYLLGTALGMLPGVFAINLFTEGFIEAMRDPSWKSLVLPGVVALAFVGFIVFVRKRASIRAVRTAGTEEAE
jgi:phosphatidylserine/phosphatidylglycerophosphate/cardiolipin synthase-like enzyme/uncharacterized membrane protein YdjX (TVP38/TMEM64 family)